VKRAKSAIFTTGNGEMKTNGKVATCLLLPKFYANCIIEHEFHIMNNSLPYDVIIGNDLMRELGILLDFKSQ
jgi:hypothetical protein